MDAGHNSQGITKLITRKLENLEKRVKKMMEKEKKLREKLEIDKEEFKKKTSFDRNRSQSLEMTTGITQTLDKRNTRIEAQFSRLEAQQTRIMERLNTEGPRKKLSLQFLARYKCTKSGTFHTSVMKKKSCRDRKLVDATIHGCEYRTDISDREI